MRDPTDRLDDESLGWLAQDLCWWHGMHPGNQYEEIIHASYSSVVELIELRKKQAVDTAEFGDSDL